MFKKIKALSWGYVFLGLFLFAVGVCFMIFASSLKILAIAIGAILTLFGLIYGFIAISEKARNFRFAIKIALAVICICGGIVTMIFSGRAGSVLVAIFCLLLIVDGSFKLSAAAESRRYALKGSWIMLTVSSVVIVSAFITAILLTPTSASSSYTLGAVIIVDAVSNLISSVSSPKCARARDEQIYLKIKKEMENIDN